jgi:hypothetical protein
MSRETEEDAAYRQREELIAEVRELRKAVEVLTGLMFFVNYSNTGTTWENGITRARDMREALDQ